MLDSDNDKAEAILKRRLLGEAIKTRSEHPVSEICPLADLERCPHPHFGAGVCISCKTLPELLDQCPSGLIHQASAIDEAVSGWVDQTRTELEDPLNNLSTSFDENLKDWLKETALEILRQIVDDLRKKLVNNRKLEELPSDELLTVIVFDEVKKAIAEDDSNNEDREKVKKDNETKDMIAESVCNIIEEYPLTEVHKALSEIMAETLKPLKWPGIDQVLVLD